MQIDKSLQNKLDNVQGSLHLLDFKDCFRMAIELQYFRNLVVHFKYSLISDKLDDHVNDCTFIDLEDKERYN